LTTVIEGKTQEKRIVIRVTTDGKYFYDHVIEKKNKPPEKVALK